MSVYVRLTSILARINLGIRPTSTSSSPVEMMATRGSRKTSTLPRPRAARTSLCARTRFGSKASQDNVKSSASIFCLHANAFTKNSPFGTATPISAAPIRQDFRRITSPCLVSEPVHGNRGAVQVGTLSADRFESLELLITTSRPTALMFAPGLLEHNTSISSFPSAPTSLLSLSGLGSDLQSIG